MGRFLQVAGPITRCQRNWVRYHLSWGSVDGHWAVPGGLSMDIARRVLVVTPAAVNKCRSHLM